MKTEEVLIIAEIGSNHDGSLDKARELINAAADSGAQVCKFQSFLADDMLATDHPDYELLKKLEMPREWYPLLMDHCASRGVRFLSTATNVTTLDWMEECGAWGYKVASCNITHVPLLERLVEIGKPVIVSTGLARLEEIQGAERLFLHGGLSDYAFLHCVSKYPCPPHEMRLRNIAVLQEVLSCPVGLSDHSKGYHLAVAATALGVSIIEKHITLTGEGLSPDHLVAVTPAEFSEMHRAVRETERAMVADFRPDLDGIRLSRRSLHYVRDMNKGEVLSEEDIKIIRPEDGLLPRNLPIVVGMKLDRDVESGKPVKLSDLET